MTGPGPAAAGAPEDAPRRWYRSPFLWAFVIGIAVLTVLPFLQRRFLSAPPPLATLPPWELRTPRGPLAPQVEGKVLLMMLAPMSCDAACVERQAGFLTGERHTDDLGDAVHLVTVAPPGAVEALSTLDGGARWHLASGSPAEVDRLLWALRAGWATFAGTDAGATAEDFARLPAVMVVDQERGLRGFWKDDAAGRGNAINAARLLGEYGPRPSQRRR